MSSSTPRLPEQYGSAPHVPIEFHISEFTSDMAGSLSPFGADDPFPLPLDKIIYTHPGPADRPNLAADGN